MNLMKIDPSVASSKHKINQPKHPEILDVPAWNSIDYEIKSALSVKQFKLKLNKEFLEKYIT